MPKKLGEILLESGLITEAELNIALAHQKENRKKIGEIIVELKIASEMDIVQTLSSKLGIPYIDMSSAVVEPVAIELVSESLARSHSILPLSIDGKVLTIAMLDPLDFAAIDDVRFSTGLKVRPLVTTKAELLHAIDTHYSASQSIAELLVSDLSQEESSSLVEIVYDKEGVDLEALKKKSETPPIIRMVNLIISDAIKAKASDIHIEPHEKKVLIRDRVDGMLRDIMDLPKWVQGAMISRVKIMAKMDIAEKRIPQDGRVKLRVDSREVDLRVSTLPTQYGESVVLRLLETKGASIPLEKLGFSDTDAEKVVSIISKPQGVVLITGPTGSGKSSTLYGIINRIKKEFLNIITLEDPIEYEIEGVNQVMIDENVGLTFANGLRSVLRQDPNVIMVGEMRDRETAEIAMQASLTGHLVVSTMHTNDATGSVIRLIDLGIQPYLIASSLNGVIAQRLVRVICPHCKEQYTPSKDELLYIKVKDFNKTGFKFYKGKGCDKCRQTGYLGRIGVYEVFPITAGIKEMIAMKALEAEIRQAAIADGMRTIGEDALEKVKMGITTFEELGRIISLEGESASMCSFCGRVLSEEFGICPYCGNPVETHCPKCGKHRSPEWIVCPYCKTSYSNTG